MSDPKCTECGGYGSIYDRYYGISAWRLCPKCNGGHAKLTNPKVPPDGRATVRDQATQIRENGKSAPFVPPPGYLDMPKSERNRIREEWFAEQETKK